MRLVLASASPARLATLRSAGFAPAVVVSDVDEDAVLAGLADGAGYDARAATPAGAPVAVPADVVPPAEQVLALARAKARDVAGRAGHEAAGALVVGCDSMLEMVEAGRRVVVGKPGTPERATERWRAMRGASATLFTGHWVVRAPGPGVGDLGPLEAGGVSATVVHFARLDDAEIEAYVATGEPLQVAGAFTIDGLGGPFVERIEGDHHGVVGLSLPLLRNLAAEVGVRLTDLWAGH